MKQKRTSSPGINLHNRLLWVIAAVAILFGLFLLTKTLSRPPQSKPINSLLSLNKQDLDTYTRMIGAIQIDTTLIFCLNSNLRNQMEQVLKMVANRELADAITRLNRMLRRRPAYEQGLIQMLIGFCYYELGQPEPALAAFRTGVKLLDTLRNRDEYTCRLISLHGFNAGYLFQFYSQPDSARRYYLLSQEIMRSLPHPDKKLTGAILNNLGVTFETSGDIPNAHSLYLEALNYIDTTLLLPEAERLRKNLNRTSTQSPVGQHQP